VAVEQVTAVLKRPGNRLALAVDKFNINELFFKERVGQPFEPGQMMRSSRGGAEYFRLTPVLPNQKSIH
jgi:hypothetical protein